MVQNHHALRMLAVERVWKLIKRFGNVFVPTVATGDVTILIATVANCGPQRDKHGAIFTMRKFDLCRDANLNQRRIVFFWLFSAVCISFKETPLGVVR